MKVIVQPLTTQAFFIAVLLLTALGQSTDCFGFQFAMSSIGASPAQHRSADHRIYRHRRSHQNSSRHRRFSAAALQPFSAQIHHRQVEIFALPYYWSHQSNSGRHDAVLSRPAINAADYPSNITAYDAQFRGHPTGSSLHVDSNPLAVPSSSVPSSSVSSSAVHWSSNGPASTEFQSAAVLENPASFAVDPPVNSRLQSAQRSPFDLQQRLLETREIPSIRSAAAASNLQGHAEKAFLEGRYHDAAYYSDQATEADPHNGLIYLFSSQCHFAIQKYSVAILMLEHATTKLPESQWDYVVKHYETFYGHNDYVTHTQALANYLRRRPDDNRARTLLGYHYGCLGYKTTASQLFHQSLQTYRNDELAQRLIPIFGDPTFASTVIKSVDAPTPELLQGPTIGEPMYLSSTGNPLIFLTPGPSVINPPSSPTTSSSPTSPSRQGAFSSSMEELPSPEEIFFDADSTESEVPPGDRSILLPPLSSPREIE